LIEPVTLPPLKRPVTVRLSSSTVGAPEKTTLKRSLEILAVLP